MPCKPRLARNSSKNETASLGSRSLAGAAEPLVTRTPVKVMRERPCSCLDDWYESLPGNVAEARQLLDLMLAEHVGFMPTVDRGYDLNVSIEQHCPVPPGQRNL